MDWHLITNFMFGAIEKIVEIGSKLFETITLQDALIAIPKLIVGWVKPGFANTFAETIIGFFQHNGWDFMTTITFTPIQIISGAGIVIILVMGAIKLVSIFS